jgi:hypothetical protein
MDSALERGWANSQVCALANGPLPGFHLLLCYKWIMFLNGGERANGRAF